ncbi:MAG: glyoxalase/bleomycin resistance/dioxygenase family protein [Candidatus Methanofastidiosum sp.]|nr:glyoxalase/bleomycin resistance/dioxygenase family protein [Methanofastidiosum sp.]NYT14031.1 glyoxalase/bleomycin resistance/dioxygenase family protein [Candidatus Methanofastidiosa archaeon]
MSKLNYSMTVIFVEDISISKNFYQDIFGLEIEMDFGENVVFKKAFSIWQRKRAEKIIFQKEKETQINKQYNNIELYFETKDISSIWEKIIASKLEIIHPIKEEQWGQRVFRIYDPDRFILEVAEPMGEVIKRFHKLGFSDEKISMKTQMPLELVKKTISDTKS